jgi:hypothetical protein
LGGRCYVNSVGFFRFCPGVGVSGERGRIGSGHNRPVPSRTGVRQFADPGVSAQSEGKDIQLVGLGSYFVNAIGGCSDCHSFPKFLPQGDTAGSNPAAGDPYQGTPSTQSVNGQLVANFSTSNYLAGGQCFGPFMARNLTPDAHSLPQGLTEEEFVKVMRAGEDIHCKNIPSIRSAR